MTKGGRICGSKQARLENASDRISHLCAGMKTKIGEARIKEGEKNINHQDKRGLNSLRNLQFIKV